MSREDRLERLAKELYEAFRAAAKEHYETMRPRLEWHQQAESVRALWRSFALWAENVVALHAASGVN